ncbi:PH domain-containing protein [Hyalangium rubrum]|uniref:PH domain-containing protein n=1 Tax=Hyalangium rubrum TaxID=3103134 RepID=A0ABU5GYC8_9BACT|nr:PH domain-containing protein [Hyalangium sp. s54d21]MDY7226076.1 PH domain-containing protein [Hyalangium sp. s54d21]
MSEALPPIERLTPGALTLFRLEGLIRAGLYGLPVAGLALAMLVAEHLLWALLALCLAVVLALLLCLWYPSRAWRSWGYAVREHDLLITGGVLIHQVVSIPAGRIQHVDIQQGPIERALGLARVRVYTASGGGADGVIPGLALETADALRERLVRREAEDVV